MKINGKITILVLVGIMFVLGLTSVSAAGQSESSESHHVFGMTVMADAAFFDAIEQGANVIIANKGDRILYASAKLDAQQQQNIIEDFIANSVDLVFYNPADSQASLVSLRMLQEAGIPIINFDSRCADVSYCESYCATDNYAGGVVAAQYMMEEHPNGGKVAIIDFPAAESARVRADGFVDTIVPTGKWKVVARLDGTNTAAGALQVAQDILTANPDLTAMFSINDEMGQSCYNAIKGAGANVDLYSLGGGPESKSAMKADGLDGIWRATAAQSPLIIGKTIAEMGYKVLAGESVEKEVLIKPFIISPQNIAEYGQSDWQ